MDLVMANMLLGVLANAVRFYAIKRFITLFFVNDKCRWNHTWILYVVACCYTSLIYELFKSPAWNVLANLSGLFLVTFPYKVKALKKFFLILIIYIVNIAVDGIVVFSFTKYVLGEPFNQVYGCVTSLIILLISIVLEKTVLPEKDIQLPAFYGVILGIVPVVSILCIYSLTVIEIEQEQVRIIVSSFSSWILLVNIVIFYLYNALKQFYSEKIEKKMFEQMVEVYSYQLDIVQESQERVNALRHDMKHHIIELSSMIKKEDYPEVIRYLKNMEKFMLNPKEHATTGNKAFDGVLNYLLQDVEESLDCVNIKISIPEKNHWKDFSICVILGNLIDNAVREASKSEEKFLEINVQSKKGIILIYIENSYTGEIVEQENKFKTSQKMIAVHGIGLENVKKMVEANGGEISINYENNRFKVEVLLYLSNIK